MLVHITERSNEQDKHRMRLRLLKATVAIPVSFSRARISRTERERLFAKLERFVNLGDSVEDFRTFESQDSEFLPFVGYDETRQELTHTRESGQERREVLESELADLIGPEPAKPLSVHERVLEYRNALRMLWVGCGGPRSARACAKHLEFLLDLHGVGETPFAAYGPPPSARHVTWPGTTLMPDWWSGKFLLFCALDFPRAICLLWEERWRAKTCGDCQRYFVAAKPATKFCSSKCAGEARRKRDLDYWHEHGKKERAKRRAKAKGRPKQSQRKQKGGK